VKRSLWFVVPAHGRAELARICLTQLRRTCDALEREGIRATAVVVADDANLTTARRLGFGTIKRDNSFLSAKFNDGIQAALDPHLTDPPDGYGHYEVTGDRKFRGHTKGARFTVKLNPFAERRAVDRGDIVLLSRERITFQNFTPPDGWDGPPADFVVPMGSDDWIDHRILLTLPGDKTVVGFQRLSFVREDGRELRTAVAAYTGGCGMRIYPRNVFAANQYRPADEDRTRACDTSILVNTSKANGGHLNVVHADKHDHQIVDWKNPAEQINAYAGVIRQWGRGPAVDPFVALAGIYPREALTEMAAFYAAHNQQGEVQ
jgi:hypothetical protein